MTISKTAEDLILDIERCSSKLKWPEEQSRASIGFGYDLGCATVDQFESDWGERIGPDASQHLKAVVNLRALRARNHIGDLSDIRVSRKAAEQAFGTRTLPLDELRNAQAFPGVDALPEDVGGALVSLV